MNTNHAQKWSLIVYFALFGEGSDAKYHCFSKRLRLHLQKGKALTNICPYINSVKYLELFFMLGVLTFQIHRD